MVKVIYMMCFILITPLIADSWRYKVSKDEMTGEMSYYVSSPMTLATKTMDFPYTKTKSWIGVGCKDGKQWAYFGFNNSPNLIKSKTEDGYSVSNSRIKIGKELSEVSLTQEWGSKFLQFANSYSGYSNYLSANKFVKKIKKANSVLIDVNWHGNGNTYFKYSLNGSSKALNRMQKECGYKAPSWENQKIEDFGKEEVKKAPIKNQKNMIKTDRELEQVCLDDRLFFVRVGSVYGCSEESSIGLTDKDNCENIGGHYNASNSTCS